MMSSKLLTATGQKTAGEFSWGYTKGPIFQSSDPNKPHSREWNGVSKVRLRFKDSDFSHLGETTKESTAIENKIELLEASAT